MKLCSLLFFFFFLWLSGEASAFFHLFHTATKVVENAIRKTTWHSECLHLRARAGEQTCAQYCAASQPNAATAAVAHKEWEWPRSLPAEVQVSSTFRECPHIHSAKELLRNI